MGEIAILYQLASVGDAWNRMYHDSQGRNSIID